VVGTPDQAPMMVVPADRTIRIELRATDVIHSFYVPEFLFKRDAIPGEENSFDLVVPEVGTYYGECAEYCGLDHVDMVFYVQAVSRSDFDAWVAEQQSAQESAEEAT
jgi:cytochrome c oxidase subunit II